MKSALLMLLLCASAAAQADLPLPAPIRVFDIRDIGQPQSPVRCFGTANAYVKPQPGNLMMSWVEDTGLQVENRSDKVIIKMTIEVLWKEIKGDGSTDVGYLEFDPKHTIKPGAVWKQKFAHVPGARPTYSLAEYNTRPTVEPKVKAHVVYVVFDDDSFYSEAAYDGPWPLE